VDVSIRPATSDDLDEVLAMVCELAEFVRKIVDNGSHALMSVVSPAAWNWMTPRSASLGNCDTSRA